jgi:hypothetical protein
MRTIKDNVIIGFLSLFCLIAWSIELYWFVNHNVIHLSPPGLISSAFSFYGRADSTWYNVQDAPPFAMAFMLYLEGIHIFITQTLGLCLIYAIWNNKHYRYTLQLLLSSYVAYSVLAYYGIHQLAGFPCMKHKTLGAYLIFYLFNAPYLVYFWLAYDSVKEINRRTRDNGNRTSI